MWKYRIAPTSRAIMLGVGILFILAGAASAEDAGYPIDITCSLPTTNDSCATSTNNHSNQAWKEKQFTLHKKNGVVSTDNISCTYGGCGSAYGREPDGVCTDLPVGATDYCP
jgi:hypothetical protein